MAFDWQTEYHRYRRYFVDIGEVYKKRKKIRVYTEITLSFLIVSFFLFFAIKPTLLTIAELVKTINDQKLVTEQLQAKIKTLGSAQTEYNLIQNEVYLVDEALPIDTRTSILIKQLEVLARQSGVTIESFKLDQVYLRGDAPKETQETKEKTQTKGTTQPINFTFSTSGEYQNLKSFLQSLTALRRIITVESFAFKAGRTENQGLGLSLNARAFYLKENQ